jgi:hypothetical protein
LFGVPLVLIGRPKDCLVVLVLESDTIFKSLEDQISSEEIFLGVPIWKPSYRDIVLSLLSVAA